MRTLLFVTALALAACSAAPPDPVGGGGVDAVVNTTAWPVWQLEDVQPTSARAGETYGLDAFEGKIVVMSLLQGF